MFRQFFRQFLLPLLVCLLSTSALADDVYKTVDKDGKVTFTDSPANENVEKVEIKDTNTLPATKITENYSGSSNSSKDTAYNLHIQSPSDGSQVTPTQKTLTVSVSLNRPLGKGHTLQLFLNGSASGPPSESTTLTASNLRRGQQRVTVSVLDNSGSVIASSSAITVYVIRPNPKRN